ncbi:plasmid-partitioning protein SopA, partial [Klebsiella variicola]|nr:plasmid-partitioning protein SopA [Klebsiella variicola]
ATPAELFDYSSVLQFFTMLLDLLKTVDLGGFEPVVRLLLTKYSLTTGNQSRWMEEQIRNTWGSMVLRQVVRGTDEVGKGQIKMRTVFEQAANQRSTLNAWRNAVSIW